MPLQNTQRESTDQVLDALLSELLAARGFSAVRPCTRKRMKFVEAHGVDGGPVTFWLKKDWTGGQRFAAAISFGGAMREGSAQLQDQVFAEYVDTRVATAKAEGAQYLLMVHIVDGAMHEFAVLGIEDVAQAYRQQLAHWPSRARNGGAAQLWFHEERDRPDAECVNVVRALSIPLSSISGLQRDAGTASQDVKTVWAEVERRMKQDAFRTRVGGKYGWKCAVSGNEVREVLEAAHLPGKDWRHHNNASDGVMLRVDLHRLLDRGLAKLRDGRFWIEERARCEEYVQFHGRPYVRD